MIQHGGPAFPSFDRGDVSAFEGMTLRDYFAGQALAGLMAVPYMEQQPSQTVQQRARWAYENADAMLAAREKP